MVKGGKEEEKRGEGRVRRGCKGGMNREWVRDNMHTKEQQLCRLTITANEG